MNDREHFENGEGELVKLGEGRFSTVYRALLHDEKNNETGYFALKVNNESIELVSGEAPKILREVSALIHVDHPQVLRLHHVFTVSFLI